MLKLVLKARRIGLVKKQIVNSKGHKTSVWIRPDEKQVVQPKSQRRHNEGKNLPNDMRIDLNKELSKWKHLVKVSHDENMLTVTLHRPTAAHGEMYRPDEEKKITQNGRALLTRIQQTLSNHIKKLGHKVEDVDIDTSIRAGALFMMSDAFIKK